MPPPPTPKPEVEIEIEKLVYGGDGLARLPPDPADPSFRREAVFVPFVLPGERVRVELEPRARGRRTARLLEVLTPSPDRIAAACEYYGRCGGCQLQHIAYPRQLALKREILLETLRRTGGPDLLAAFSGDVTLHAADPWAYRNRVQLVARPGIGIGYREHASHRIVPITHCPIASPEINRAIAALAADPPREATELELAESNFTVHGHPFRVTPGSFFQVNRFLVDELAATVTAGVAGTHAMDLFSGVGLFALPLAASYSIVDAVESHPSAVADLRHNAQHSPAIRVHAQSALDFVRARPASAPDLIVADPPRAGLGPELVDALIAARPRRLRLVACDPSTLGRDLAPLLAAGFALTHLHLFDLFPQTHHLETLADLVL